MASKALISLLKGLDLYKSPSVFFLHEDDGKSFAFKNKELKSRLALIKPTAFYIFNHQPLILFFDLSEVSDQESEKEIHKKVWSFDQSPIIFVVKTSEVKIFNAFSYNKRKEELDEINISGVERNEQFSFWNLQSGNTWRWLQSEYYEKKNIQKKRVNQKLYENIKAVRQGLLEASNKIGEDDANILILRLIFIRYLIDRDVKLSKEFITGDNILKRRKSLIHLIEEPRKLNECFVWLNEKFNGVLFKDIKVQLSKETSIQLAKVFDGEIPDGLFKEAKDLYFEVFDFSIIPIELISGIYEALLDEETRKLHSAVYTPLFLVEYILTQTIDKHFEHKQNKSISECKVFDPSVGSGIFLVQAFRRMVDREIELFGKVSKTRLKEIAKNNLFGIDINRQALKVSCFSIYIAMLDYQDSATVTDNFKFPELIDTNLFEADFFNTNADYNEIILNKGLDFILGNPPWKRNNSKLHLEWVNSQKIYSEKKNGKIEIAQNFLLRSKVFMNENTVSSLIVTSTIFYNISSTTKEFKNKFLTTFCVSDFFDLSPVKQSLFEQQESPTIVVKYKLSNKTNNYSNNIISHKSLKPNVFLKHFNTLVLEKNDYKEIKQNHFVENDWMFKVALYGNVLDFSLLIKLKQQSSKLLINLIDNKTLRGKSGILVGNKKGSFPFLEGLPIFENNEIQEYYSNSPERKITNKETNLEAGREFENFSTAKILIKEQAKDWSKIVISFNETSAVYKKGVFGLSSNEIELLKKIYAYLISELYTYYIFMISGGWGIATHPQIKWKEEYLSFPYVEFQENICNEIAQLVEEFLLPYKEYNQKFNLGEPKFNKKVFEKINKTIEKLYHIKGYEKDLISYVLDISRYQFQESKIEKVIRKVHKDNSVLESYADVFIEQFKDLYKDEYLQIEVYALDYFIAMNFVFKSEKPKERIVFNQTETTENAIFKAISKNLTVTKISEDLFVQKDIKGFEDDSFYIIKPNEYKCWHRAMAWYDVAEIKSTIEEAEIEHLNNVIND